MTSQRENKWAATCSGEPYHGQPLHLWQLDYSVVNGSERQLEWMAAGVTINAPSPPCQEVSLSQEIANAIDLVPSGETVHLLHALGMAPKDTVSGTAFVLAFHKHQPEFGSGTLSYEFAERCAEPAALACSSSGKWRLDPTLLMISSRRFFDSDPDPGEINPFKGGAAGFDLRLAGLEGAYLFPDDLSRIGLNGSFGISNYVYDVGKETGMMAAGETGMMATDAPAVITTFSASLFLQVKNLYRIEAGIVYATTDFKTDAGDKTAWFIGISFPLPSDQVRKLIEKLW